jgi:hypothetical protein
MVYDDHMTATIEKIIEDIDRLNVEINEARAEGKIELIRALEGQRNTLEKCLKTFNRVLSENINVLKG